MKAEGCRRMWPGQGKAAVTPTDGGRIRLGKASEDLKGAWAPADAQPGCCLSAGDAHSEAEAVWNLRCGFHTCCPTH